MSGFNQIPRSERIHIGIFGKRNAGKSSLFNAITGQNAAVVSPVKGTTTDPVLKSMEFLPIGPVVFIDTPGIDDEGELGSLRMDKTKKYLRKIHAALLVIDALEGMTEEAEELKKFFEKKGIPYFIVYNKADLMDKVKTDQFYVSALTGENIHLLKEKIVNLIDLESEKKPLAADLLDSNDIVILVIPIDESAPKGRLILPQQQVIRDILETGAVSLIVPPSGLSEAIRGLKYAPHLVITDSQVFEHVAKVTPKEVGLTSFSILMARYKGGLEQAVSGAKFLDAIKKQDKILVSEGCTHHRQCEDIGTVKLPKMIEKYLGFRPDFVFTSGENFPDDLSDYKMIIHCGGCMLNKKEMDYRYHAAIEAGIPITNYGVVMSYMQGILERCIAPLEIRIS